MADLDVDIVDAVLLRVAQLAEASRDMLPANVIASRAIAVAELAPKQSQELVQARHALDRAERAAVRDRELAENLLRRLAAAVRLIKAAPRPLTEAHMAVLLHDLLLTLESSSDPQAVTR